MSMPNYLNTVMYYQKLIELDNIEDSGNNLINHELIKFKYKIISNNIKKNLHKTILEVFPNSEFYIVYIINNYSNKLFNQKIYNINILVSYINDNFNTIKETGGLLFFIVSPNYLNFFINVNYRNEVILIEYLQNDI